MAVVDFDPLRQRVHDRRSHAVQTAREFIPVSSEFTACVQNGIHDFQRRDAHFRVNAARDSAPVVLHRAAAVRQEGDLDPLTSPRQCFVDGVIDDFVHKVVQSSDGG